MGLALLLGPPPAAAEGDLTLSLYGGQFSGSRNGDVIALMLQDSYAVGFGVIKEFEQSPPHLRWEVETVALRHFGRQDHQEVAASVNVRWVTFPWDAYADTSVAFGGGLSYATEVPAVEARDNPETGSTRLLHYIMIELAVAVPGTARWSLVGRIHHRSGAWGLFDGVGRASNIFLGGVRYRF
ncbi:MAG: hypothetical protein ACREJG_03505 [Candidatus Rokuibacteriota bacterium]